MEGFTEWDIYLNIVGHLRRFTLWTQRAMVVIAHGAEGRGASLADRQLRVAARGAQHVQTATTCARRAAGGTHGLLAVFAGLDRVFEKCPARNAVLSCAHPSRTTQAQKV